jgi:membrane protein YqaA with SNARE-associated domain
MRFTTHTLITMVMLATMWAAAIPLQGCAPLAAAAAGGAVGGAVGYGLAYNGYEVQSPIARPDDHADTRPAQTEHR